MTHKGRHATDSAGSFYRDLVMMIVGIILVGAAVFLLLYFTSRPLEPAASGSSTTTTTTAGSTTSGVSSTTGETTTTPPTSSTTTTLALRDPSEVRVVVLNSIGLAGAAGRKTQTLADAGYQTQQAGDYEPEQDPSRIWYREGFAAEANVLLEFLPGALVEPIPDPDLEIGADVVLVLGTGYQE